jgi:osmoprotectant transport system permease protein
MAAGGGGPMTQNPIVWLNDPLNYQGRDGVVTHLVEHLQYSMIAIVVATLIGLPIGLVIGHSGRFTAAVSLANAMRALPTIGLLILFVVMISPHIGGRGDAAYLIPTELVLIVLAIPPILSNTYAGVQSIDPAARDAAAGMGMTGRQVLLQVELPNSLPLVFSGVRSAVLQVIATATIAAYVGLNGLGRFVYDGLATQDYGRSTAGALLVALLAVAADLILAVIQRYTVSRGVSGRFSRRGAALTGGSVGAAVATAEVMAR